MLVVLAAEGRFCGSPSRRRRDHDGAIDGKLDCKARPPDSLWGLDSPWPLDAAETAAASAAAKQARSMV